METAFQPQPFRHQTLPQQLADFLKADLLSRHQPGDCLPSINQLSSVYQVSPMTLRAALSILSQQGYVDIRHGSGTYVSDLNHQRHVALVWGLDIAQPQSFFRPHVVQYLRSELWRQGIRSRIYLSYSGNGPEDCPDLVQEIGADRVRCAIVLNGLKHSAANRLLEEKKVPVIGLWGGGEYFVMPNYEEFIREGVRRLAAAGRQRIAMIEWNNGAREAHDSPHFGVFRQAMAEHSLEVNEAWYRNDIFPNLRGAGWSLFRELWMADRVKPDAVLVTDDMLFQGVQTAIEEMNISVPDQLRVVTLGIKDSAEPCVIPAEVAEVDPQMVGAALMSIAVPLLNQQEIRNGKQVLSMKWKSVTADSLLGDETGLPARISL